MRQKFAFYYFPTLKGGMGLQEAVFVGFWSWFDVVFTHFPTQFVQASWVLCCLTWLHGIYNDWCLVGNYLNLVSRIYNFQFRGKQLFSVTNSCLPVVKFRMAHYLFGPKKHSGPSFWASLVRFQALRTDLGKAKWVLLQPGPNRFESLPFFSINQGRS